MHVFMLIAQITHMLITLWQSTASVGRLMETNVLPHILCHEVVIEHIVRDHGVSCRRISVQLTGLGVLLCGTKKPCWI